MSQRSIIKWIKEGDTNTDFFSILVLRVGLEGMQFQLLRQVMTGLKGSMRFVTKWLTIFLTILENLTMTDIGQMGSFSVTSLRRIILSLPLPSSSVILVELLLWTMAIRFPDLIILMFHSLRGFGPFLRMILGLCFDHFHQCVSLHPSFSSFFVILISKVYSSSQSRDFQHISQVRSLYQSLTKVFVARLFSIMDKLISHNQIKNKLLIKQIKNKLLINKYFLFSKKKNSTLTKTQLLFHPSSQVCFNNFILLLMNVFA